MAPDLTEEEKTAQAAAKAREDHEARVSDDVAASATQAAGGAGQNHIDRITDPLNAGPGVQVGQIHAPDSGQRDWTDADHPAYATKASRKRAKADAEPDGDDD